jgi:hypothetical protein
VNFSGRRATASIFSALAIGVALTGCGSSDSSAKGDVFSSDKSSPTSTLSTDSSTTSTPTDTATDTPSDTATASGSQHEALTSMAKQAQASIPNLMKAFDGMYSKISIETEDPGTIIYSYTYAKAIDGKAGESALKQQYPTLQSSCETAVYPAMKAGGVTVDPKVKYEFHNSDGSLVGSYTCVDK